MKATAKANVKYNGTWYTAGDSFDVKSEDISALADYIETSKNVELEVKPSAKTEEKQTKDEKRKLEKAE